MMMHIIGAGADAFGYPSLYAYQERVATCGRYGECCLRLLVSLSIMWIYIALAPSTVTQWGPAIL